MLPHLPLSAVFFSPRFPALLFSVLLAGCGALTVTSGGSQPTQPTPPGSVDSIDHVIFMMQENHTFDNYFGMLNPYRKANGWNIGDDGKDYEVDGIDDKLSTISNEDDEGASFSLFKFTSTCVDDMSSDWLASYGDVNRYDFLTTRPINMDGYVHDAEGYAKSCAASERRNLRGRFYRHHGPALDGLLRSGILELLLLHGVAVCRAMTAGFRPLRARALPTASQHSRAARPKAWSRIRATTITSASSTFRTYFRNWMQQKSHGKSTTR